MVFDDTFDATSSLAALVLWLVFNYLALLLNCDLQRSIQAHELVRHALGYLAFYFLFTSLDNSNDAPVHVTLLKTFLVYSLFVLATKSKWPFVVAVLTLLLADQILKNHAGYLQKKGKPVPAWIAPTRRALFWAIVAVVFVGFGHYAVRQRAEFGDQFSWYRLVFTNGNCKV